MSLGNAPAARGAAPGPGCWDLAAPPLKGWQAMGRTALVKRCLASVLALALSQYGCVSRQLAPTVVSYNLAVEQAQNEVLLLNAIRAEHHLPMYLTDISKITGSIRRDVTASVALPFGPVLHAGGERHGGGDV